MKVAIIKYISITLVIIILCFFAINGIINIPKEKYALQIKYDKNGGVIEGEGKYFEGENVHLKAVPKDGYEFIGWYKDVDIIGWGDGENLLSEKKEYDYTFSLGFANVVAIFEKSLLNVSEKYYINLDSIKKEENLNFCDEFEGNELNQEYWTIRELYYDETNTQRIPNRGGYWCSDSIIIEDGLLKIRTFEENGKYYSSSINTNGKFEQLYGYFEICCTLPAAYGIWGAFWMLNDRFYMSENDDSNIWGAEVDIFESPIYPNSTVGNCIHTGGIGEGLNSYENLLWRLHKYEPDLYKNFSNYGLYWDENIYKFYINNKCVWTTSKNHNISGIPLYMIISVEINGDNGIPSSSFWTYGKDVYDNNEGTLPVDMSVEYVKTYFLNNQ